MPSSSKWFLNSVEPDTALVHGERLETAAVALMLSRQRRAGRAGGKPMRAGPKLLALKVETLLRFMAKRGLPYPKANYLAATLKVSQPVMSRAISMLSRWGISRAEGGKGAWSIPVPMSKAEVVAEYVAVPSCGLFNLSDKDFTVLALLHRWGESQKQAEKRKEIVPLAGPVLLGPLGEVLGVKTLRRSLHRLRELGFIAPSQRGSVYLSPHVATKKAKATHPDIFALLTAGVGGATTNAHNDEGAAW